MKYLTAVLLLVISLASTAEHSVGLAYNRIDYKMDFENPIRYKNDAVEVSYMYMHSLTDDLDVGTRISLFRSTETPNFHDIEIRYRNKLYESWRGKVGARYNFTETFSLAAFAGLCEFHNTVTVNGKEVSWSKGVGSHKPCYSVHSYHDVRPNLKVEVFAGLDYKKHKIGFGKKQMRSYGVGVIYTF